MSEEFYTHDIWNELMHKAVLYLIYNIVGVKTA